MIDETKPSSAETTQAIEKLGRTYIREFPPQDGRNYECQCARCGSSCDSQGCEQCDDGFDGHDCGEDTCCCLHPKENVVCQICRGYGHWYRCMSSAEFCKANPLPGRESVERGLIEWFVVKEPA